jgi:hypothetical protein
MDCPVKSVFESTAVEDSHSLLLCCSSTQVARCCCCCDAHLSLSLSLPSKGFLVSLCRSYEENQMSGKRCESKPTKRHRFLNNLEARKYSTFIIRPGPRDETLQVFVYCRTTSIKNFLNSRIRPTL